jgi:NADH-quinone oxidoreductase subunit I
MLEQSRTGNSTLPARFLRTPNQSLAKHNRKPSQLTENNHQRPKSIASFCRCCGAQPILAHYIWGHCTASDAQLRTQTSRVTNHQSPITTHESPLTHRLPVSTDSAKVNAMASLIQEVGETFFTLYKGFSVTLRTMFRKTTTESFPDAPPTVQPRYRGIHVLQRDEHGYEKCVGCFLCAAACPANCIYIEAAENTAANRISAGERYAKVYNIDYSRCIFCGYCVEACPTDAITHGHSIELAPYNINALIYRKEQLLEPWPPRTKQS